MFAVSGDVVMTYAFAKSGANVERAHRAELTAATRLEDRKHMQQKYGRPLTFLPDGKTLLFQREEQEESRPDREWRERGAAV